ncbi:DUF3800 domain-containing protein [Propionibacterium freudenreichii]|uniref:DUF3800 domain-containing protein n=1 Tax=Propionibacterium freudenreichii TaxID=1744 RepID=UPI000BC2D43A|nr:DUF3800 domain-containing protein [Propionibacterium freudenreichii]MDK9348515.1 DUF3800 domain-containing protein [Propionibacterium freudenreichii]MDK9627363.1 DUF3800 domain-containing protein [Propionibacterium freudenreichii]MDK9652647.1 DUF3800 domain-containing protein [Propionibacterium freudenreichii]SBN40778.1 Hypothetical protein PFR_JS4_806 [Propionibacterium freudenreichii]SCQ56122.1 Hypothetical protein PFR_JS21-1_1130 [Propionibacterium freudenreichii]
MGDYVYIDDSGDGGMKIGTGSTPHLVMSAIVFRDRKEIEHLARNIEECRRECGHRREFKFGKTNEKVKASFFEHLTDIDFAIRAIWFDKSKLYSPKLKASPKALKSYAIRELLTKNYGQIRDAKIFIDGQDTKGFDISDQSYFNRMVNRERPGTIRAVRFVDSSDSLGIQLADMTAGAIRRHTENRHKNPHACWTKILQKTWQPRGNLWEFTRTPRWQA